jgi:hypothetical protein
LLPRVTPSQPAEPYLMSDLPGSIASRITMHPVSGCWVIGGNLDRDGYARIRGEGAHRVVYRILVGPIPDDRPQLDHVRKRGCISRACCWPVHLEPVTARIDTLRGTGFAAINAAKTECVNGHEFDLYTTYYRPDGHRDCRICIRARVKKYRRRRREAAKTIRLAVLLELGRAA